VIDNRTEEEADRDANIGREAADLLLDLMNGCSVGVAYNIIGNMTVTVFLTIQYVSPAEALDEFDRWAAYTRQMIADQLKERMQ
jgi:hypothetical protein